jgi:hypothetical protein
MSKASIHQNTNKLKKGIVLINFEIQRPRSGMEEDKNTKPLKKEMLLLHGGC